MNDVNRCVCCGQILIDDNQQVCSLCAGQDNTLSALLREAMDLKERKAQKNLTPDYIDYEHFKQRLHHSGYYGHEKQLADILGL